MRPILAVLVAGLSLPAQSPQPWTPPDAAGLEFVLHRPAGATPAGCVLAFGEPADVAALAAALAPSGVAVAGVRDPDPRRAPACWQALHRHARDLGLDPERLALAAVGQGARAVLDLAMEERVPARGLVLLSCASPVIEGLRADLPLLLAARPVDPERTRACLQELAHQATLAGAPVQRIEIDDPGVVAASFLADRLGAMPAPADVTDGDRALALARVAADRADPQLALRWLERARDLGADLSGIAADPGFGRIRTEPAFRAWVRGHAPRGAVRLAPAWEAGRAFAVRLLLQDADGAPLPATLLELWQTDALGLYSHDGGGDDRARLWGCVVTDAEGRCELHSVRPGGYPATMIPAHVHVRVHGHGRIPWPELLFADDPRLTPEFAEAMQRRGWPVLELDAAGRGGDAVLRLPVRRGS